jgi:hypothetical protein
VAAPADEIKERFGAGQYDKDTGMNMSRRRFLRVCGAAGPASLLASAMAAEAPVAGRKYHLSISSDALQADPELLELAHRAGVTDVWLTGFLYGHWHYSLEKTRLWRQRIEKQGMAAHLINVPLGRPGDSLGSMSGDVPMTPPRHWRLGVRPDGKTYAGTSLHRPATDENCEAMRQIQAAGVKQVFLDDDFRLAREPGVIGGCFCGQHKEEFLRRTGYAEPGWRDLLEAVDRRRLAPVLRARGVRLVPDRPGRALVEPHARTRGTGSSLPWLAPHHERGRVGHGADRRYRRTMTNACRFVDTKPGGNNSSWG